jgi:hypothetical protein
MGGCPITKQSRHNKTKMVVLKTEKVIAKEAYKAKKLVK